MASLFHLANFMRLYLCRCDEMVKGKTRQIQWKPSDFAAVWRNCLEILRFRAHLGCLCQQPKDVRRL